MERALYNSLITKIQDKKSGASTAHNEKLLLELAKVYGMRKRNWTIWDELYKLRGGKVIVPKDEETKTILICHRNKNKCLSIADTALNLSSKYEVSPDDYGISLGLVSSVINSCPFCVEKQFETEKPVLVRWSNGLLYKGYVLGRKGRLCYVELDNYSTAVLDVKDVFDEFEHEVMCTLCQEGCSDPPNEIVLCDCCNTGFHQKCHEPAITDDTLKSDSEWFCQQCQDSKENGETKAQTLKPEYNLSTLACMALLEKGPCTRPTILFWIQENFKHYKDIKSDRWKARLSSTMSTSRHWITLDKTTGTWDLCKHNLPTVMRHLSEVTKVRDDLPSSLREKIPRSSENQTVVSTSFSDVLPYDVYSLTWDHKHRTNEEGVYCYCMGNGVWYKQMLQCLSCLQWFHQACVTSLTLAMLCGEQHVFVCSVCNLGEEHLTRVQLNNCQLLHLVMYHVVMTRYHGDFHLPVCLKMNVLPLFQRFNSQQYGSCEVWDLADIAKANPALFEVGAKNKNTTLYRLLTEEPPVMPSERGLRPPLPPSPQGIPHFLPPGFVVDLSNNTSGLQVDGSPPTEDYPPSKHDPLIFKDLDYYNTVPKRKKKTAIKKINISDKTKKVNPATSPQRGALSARSTRPVELRTKRSKPDADTPTNLDKSLKNSMILKRLQSGEKYEILGKRKSCTGDVEYLIAWEGLNIHSSSQLNALST